MRSIIGAAAVLILIWCITVGVAQEESCSDALLGSMSNAQEFCDSTCFEGRCQNDAMQEKCCPLLRSVDNDIVSCTSLCNTPDIAAAITGLTNGPFSCDEGTSHITLEFIKNCSVVGVPPKESCSPTLLEDMINAENSCQSSCEDDGRCFISELERLCCPGLQSVDNDIVSCTSLCLTPAIADAMSKLVDQKVACEKGTSHITLAGLKNCTAS